MNADLVGPPTTERTAPCSPEENRARAILEAARDAFDAAFVVEDRRALPELVAALMAASLPPLGEGARAVALLDEIAAETLTQEDVRARLAAWREGQARVLRLRATGAAILRRMAPVLTEALLSAGLAALEAPEGGP